MSALNDIHLTGCSPTPLASYLKALGVFRLVSEQADPAARGFWRNEAFVLSTTLTRGQLADFFLTRYAPTPLIDPWNGGSGFLKNDKAAGFLKQFEQSPSPRLVRYQAGAKAARDLCDDLNKAKQAEVVIKNEPKSLPAAQRDALRKDPGYKARLGEVQRKFKRLKEAFIPECRLKWRGPHLEWLEAAVILDSDLSPRYPSLLGSGGNDGNLDFTDNFRQRFLDLFDIAKSDASPLANTAALLEHALHGAAVIGTDAYSIGQYMPGAAGGANSSSGLAGRANVNPWDFVLFMEGAVLFSAAASRRLGATGASSASAPFAIRANAIGHASVSTKEKSARGEQWLPLWERPASLREIRALLSEGRAQLGRNAAREPVDMARAIARLGVARGISAFERYGYIERNGQSTFAVPLGRWKVSAQPHQDLLSDIDGFLRRLSREAAGERATASLVQIARRLNDAVLVVAADGASHARWQSVLVALGEADALAAALPPAKNKFGIVPRLRAGWLAAADDGTAEFRLAAAFASQERVRRHFLPLNKYGNQLDEKGGVSVVCAGRDFVADAIALLDRRLVESAKEASRSIGQDAGAFASLADVAVFLRGALDTGRILSLARALMAVDYKDKPRLPVPPANEMPDDTFALFRFCLAPRHWRTELPARADVFRRLASDDLAEASRHAVRHLRAHGHIPPLSLAAGNARLLAAALAFPLSRASRDALSRSFISTANSQ
ncbi:type I-U CRISPR-associated protein Csx17 [Horticoccus luteus]|uniref:Type I-U CRISPR-associated protein Csx17 n=1 Tax=Horticoccus luteus TaxID=2862869 RepID=A0A8F9TTK8_9BACT|nr:type I-U CRISPR-associated protein Csx17 [Horticoccus luteus]QYM78795.1 type I-U CRISPR-associated protein Csx17 [Horticoccus luteus]